MGVEVSGAAIHYPFALFCRKEHPLRAAANLVDFSYGTELVKHVRFPGTQPADTPQARCRYGDYHAIINSPGTQRPSWLPCRVASSTGPMLVSQPSIQSLLLGRGGLLDI
jgi:hypothetical protein